MIKAVIFDCFGVLTTDRWVEFCQTLPKGHIVDESRRLNHLYDAGKIDLDTFLKEVQELSGCDIELLKDIFITQSSSKNVELIKYIKELGQNYKIGLLSNVGTNWVTEYFLTAEEQQLFNAMAFSYEIGATKPDPRAYQTVADKLGLEPSECVFTDDQPRYCEGAEAVGMQAVRYQDFQQMKTDLEAVLAANPNN